MAKTCNKNDSKSVPTKKGYTNKVCGIEALSKQNVKLLIIKTCGVRIRQHTLKLREQFKRKERKYSFTVGTEILEIFAAGNISNRFKKGLQKLRGNRTIHRF